MNLKGAEGFSTSLNWVMGYVQEAYKTAAECILLNRYAKARQTSNSSSVLLSQRWIKLIVLIRELIG